MSKVEGTRVGAEPLRAAAGPSVPATPAHDGSSAVARPAETVAAGPARDGPDLGWAAACVGLLLAAAILGLTDDGRRATRRTGTRLAAALRPPLGRR